MSCEHNSNDVDKFFKDIKCADILFIFGSGVSSSLSGKNMSWMKWLECGCQNIINVEEKIKLQRKLCDNNHAKDLVKMAEHIIEILKEAGNYDKWMKEFFERIEIKNNTLARILKSLSSLPNVSFGTTNYDLLLENVTGLLPVSANVPSDNRNNINSVLFANVRKIIHLHGYYDSIQNHDDIVAGERQYETVVKDEGKQFSQRFLAAKNIIIFVGCGETINDSNIASFISFAQDSLGLLGVHYFLCRECDVSNFNLPTVKPIVYGREYKDLPIFLDRIYRNFTTSEGVYIGKLSSLSYIHSFLDNNASNNNKFEFERRQALVRLSTKPQELPHAAELKNFIKRDVSFFSKEGERIIPFLEWAKDFNDCKIKILEAPAGYGKTGLLEQLYMNILEDDNFQVPPLFILKRRKYEKKDIDGFMEKVSLDLSRYFHKYEAYFIIDGLDEMPEDSQACLFSDLNEILSINGTYKTYVLISVRRNQFDKSIIGGLHNIYQSAEICALTDDDIIEIAENAGMKESDIKRFSSFISKQRRVENIFYVTTTIKYYKEHGSVVDLIPLLDYQLEKDIEMMGKYEHKNIVNALENKALNEILANRKMPSNFNLFENMDNEDVSFSHRNIEEYLVAKVISRLDSEKIIKILMADKIVIPSLRNLTGYVLMILAESSNDLMQCNFEKLYRIIIEEQINIEILLNIETDKLTHKLKSKLMRAAIDFYTGDMKYKCPDSFFYFIETEEKLFKDMIWEKLDGLVIGKRYDVLYLFYVNVSGEHVRLNNSDVNKLKVMLFETLDYGSSKVQEMDIISSCLRHYNLSIECLSYNEIYKLIQLCISEQVNSKPELFMSICSILENSAARIKAKDYTLLLDKFFSLNLMHEIHADSIPYQISKNFFRSNSIAFSEKPFVDFSEKILIRHRFLFKKIMLKYLSFLEDSNYKSLFNYLFSFLIKYLDIYFNRSVLSESDVILFIKICYALYEKSCDDDIYEKLIAIDNTFLSFVIVMIYRKRKALGSYFCFSFFKEIFTRVYKDILLFNECKKLLSQNSFISFLKFIFNYSSINSKDDISLEIFPILPYDVSNHIKQKDNKQKTSKEYYCHKKEIEKNAFHIAFDKEQFNIEVKKIFRNIEDKGIDIIHLNRAVKDLSILFNQFVLDSIFESRKKTEVDFFSYWYDEENHVLRKMFHVSSYLHRHKLLFSDLTKEELGEVCSFVEKTVKAKDFNAGTYDAILLSYLIKQKELKKNLESILKNENRLLELIPICGFENVCLFRGSFLSDSLSINHLEWFLKLNVIVNHLEVMFEEYLADDLTRATSVNFIIKNKQKISKLIIKEFRNKSIEFLKKNITKEIHLSNQFYELAAITVDDITTNELASGMKYNEKDKVWEVTPAFSLLYKFEEGDEKEKTMALECLYKLFGECSIGEVKKNLAERIVFIKNDDYVMNHFLTECYIEKDLGVSSWVEYKVISFGVMESFLDACELYKYSWGNRDEKSQILRDIAFASFNQIKEILIKKGEINKLRDLIDNLIQLNKEDYQLQRTIVDFRIRYVIASHQVPTYEEIEEIVLQYDSFYNLK